ncbi:MAG: cache domain-containing protein [Desulfobacterales bacterium]|nr:cache domain-containing protein [Desulfobacterales bacterium]
MISFGSQSLLRALPVRIIVPVALTVILFTLAVFLLVLPKMEEQMMAGKRREVQHLTEAAWSSLAYYETRVQSGRLTLSQAQAAAVDHLESLRFGDGAKGYVWINDKTPVMVMHPHRPDLVGQNIEKVRDPEGNFMFVRMVETVEKSGEGFVDYLWHHQGGNMEMVPKISYVKGFAPWGWIIGTGLYVEDVRSEIRAVTQTLVWACSGIMGVVLLLSGVIIWEAAREKRHGLAALERSRLRERQLIQADKMASLGVLVAGVAHEVNNPATTLMLNAPSLKQAWEAVMPVLDDHFEERPRARICNMGWPDLRDRVGPMLAGILDASTRIRGIISELKDFARPSESRLDQTVDAEELVKKSLDLTHSIVKKATHHLQVVIEPGLPAIQGNFQKLQQVVINLLVNAAQSLENPGQALSVQARAVEGNLIIEISDQGPGARPEDLEKLTDPFFTTRRDEGGTGLGLSISQRIAHDHGGRLEFESLPGRGFTARLLLPRAHN